MADVTPTGILSTAPAALRDMIAATTAWQTATNSANAAAAKAFIHLAAFGEPDVAIVRPLCIVTLPRNAILGRGAFGDGSLYTIWQIDVAAEHATQHANAALAFTNAIGDVLEQLLIAGEQPGNLIINQIAIDSPPQRAKATAAERATGELADYMQMSAIVRYGIGAP